MKLFIVLPILIASILAWDGVRIHARLKKLNALTERTTAFARSLPKASTRILILGDSTAFGTGASKPEESTAGRLAALYPEAEVVNLSRNGLKLAGLQDILETIDSDEHFDIILIQIGANDIIRLTSMANIKTGIEKVLAKTQSLGEKVIVLHSGNVGDARFFPWYTRPLLSLRSFKTRDIYKQAADTFGAKYVDLIQASSGKLLKQEPTRFYAADLLHLNSEGYALWFAEIEKKL